MSRPLVVTACMFGTYESWAPQQHPPPWHFRAGGGAVHSIRTRRLRRAGQCLQFNLVFAWPTIARSFAAPFSIPQTGTVLRTLLLLRLGLRDRRGQLLGDGVAEGIVVFRDHDAPASAADDVVAIGGCKPPWGVGVAGIVVGWRLGLG